MYINLCSAYSHVTFLNNKSPDIVSQKKISYAKFLLFKLSLNEKKTSGSITSQCYYTWNSMFKRWDIWSNTRSHEYTHIVAYHPYSDIKNYFVTVYAHFAIHDSGSI